MADENPIQQLGDHYGNVGFVLIDDPDDDGPGMSGREARAFLRGLRPGAAVRQSLAAAAKALTNGG